MELILFLIAFYSLFILSIFLWDKRKGKYGKYKIGLDIHGVVTLNPEVFAWLTKIIVEAGGEVHIMTGRKLSNVLPKIEKYGLAYTHAFSITDHLLSTGEPIIKQEDDDNLWFDEEAWNRAKGEYANKHKLDITFDDSIEYAPHFERTFALLLSMCHVENKDFYEHKKGLVRQNSKKKENEL